jgi:hypothetical protein
MLHLIRGFSSKGIWLLIHAKGYAIEPEQRCGLIELPYQYFNNALLILPHRVVSELFL